MRHLWRETIWDLRENPGPSLLSFISLFVAVLAIVGIQTTAAIGEDVIVARAEQTAGRVATVSTQLPAARWSTDLVRERREVLNGTVGASSAVWAVVIMPEMAGSVTSLDAGESVPSELKLVDGLMPKVRRLPLLSGTWLVPANYPGGVVVNEAARDLLGSVGAQVMVTLDSRYPALPQRIVGVVADGGAEPTAYASLGAMLALVPTAAGNATAELLVHSPAGAAAAEGAARAAIGGMGLAPAVVEVTRVDGVDELRSQLALIALAFTVVSLIALVVAVIGMVSVGLAGVAQRSYELTIRRAIGATSGRIAAIVILTTGAVGGAASLASLSVAWLSVRFVVPQLLDPADALAAPVFPWNAASVGLGAGLLASILAAVLPAWRTRRIELASVLRQ